MRHLPPGLRAARRIAAGALIAAALAAPASAAWRPTAALPGGFARSLAVAPHGGGLVVLGTEDDAAVAPIGSDGTLGARRPLALEPFGPPFFDRSGRALILLHRVLEPVRRPGLRYPQDRERFSHAVLDARGNVIGQRAIATVDCLTCGPARMAANRRGDAVLAWTDDTRSTWAAYRRGGRRFGRPVRLFGGTRQYGLGVAIGERGHAVVAARVDGTRTILAGLLTRGGRVVTPIRAGRAQIRTVPAAAVTSRGETILAWATTGERGAPRQAVVVAARMSAGRRRFGRAQAVGSMPLASGADGGAIVIAADRAGAATVAWSGGRDPVGAGLVAVAGAPARGRFGTPQLLAPNGSVGMLATRSDGATIVSWSEHEDVLAPRRPLVALRPAGAARFGPAEALGDASIGGPPLVAFDARSRRPLALWNDGGIADLPGPGRPTLRIAVRDAP